MWMRLKKYRKLLWGTQSLEAQPIPLLSGEMSLRLAKHHSQGVLQISMPAPWTLCQTRGLVLHPFIQLFITADGSQALDTASFISFQQSHTWNWRTPGSAGLSKLAKVAQVGSQQGWHADQDHWAESPLSFRPPYYLSRPLSLPGSAGQGQRIHHPHYQSMGNASWEYCAASDETVLILEEFKMNKEAGCECIQQLGVTLGSRYPTMFSPGEEHVDASRATCTTTGWRDLSHILKDRRDLERQWGVRSTQCWVCKNSRGAEKN